MKILLKGYYGFGNLGDDILMLVSYQLLKSKYPTAVISVFSNNSINNKDVNTPSGYNLYIHKILGSEVEIIDWTFKGEFDLVFHGGGGVYFDNTYSSLSRAINFMICKLSIKRINFLDEALRKLTRKPHHIVAKERIGMGIGIGIYNKGATQLFYDLAEIGTYKKLIIRDDFSFHFLKRKKMASKNYSQNTDLAFVDSWNSRSRKKVGKIKKVGIVVKDNLDLQLEKLLIDFYKRKKPEDYEVTFLSFDENYDKKSVNTYSKFNFVQYHPMEVEKFLGELYQQDVLITSRAHGAILGACLGIPSIILNTEIKLEEVANMFPNGCLRLDAWEEYMLENTFEHMRNCYATLLEELEKEFNQHHTFAKMLIEQLP